MPRAVLPKAVALNRASFGDLKKLAPYLVAGKFFEATILFGFGVLSLWNAFAAWIGLGSLYPSVGISAALMLSLWVVFYRRLFAEQLEELEEEVAWCDGSLPRQAHPTMPPFPPTPHQTHHTTAHRTAPHLCSMRGRAPPRHRTPASLRSRSPQPGTTGGAGPLVRPVPHRP